jgi:hypothetical protein
MTLPKQRWENERWKIWKELKASSPSITVEEIDAEVFRRIGECPTSDAPVARPPAARPKQIAFVDSGQASRETRKKAFSDSLLRAETRKASVLEFIRNRGPYGATRDDVAYALPTLSPYSVPSAVLSLIGDGLVIETGLKRMTRYGKPAAVVIAKEYMPPGGQNE